MAAPYGIICDPTDFTNDDSYYNLNNDEDVIELLQTYITKYETKIIRKILGQALGDAFIADCNAHSGVPANPIYLVLFNEIAINDPNDSYNLRESEGMKNILLAHIFYEFCTSAQFKHGVAGFVNPGVDTAGKLSYQNVFVLAEWKFNEAVEWIKTIQWYCLLYSPQNNPPDNYPNFYGQKFEAISSDFL